MLCIACASPPDAGPLCSECARSLRHAPTRTVNSVLVQPVFNHSGAAVRVVHNLKYRRSQKAARFLAQHMAQRLPATATLLVPVPRVLSRRIVYGIDQTAALADMIGGITGLPVVDALASPVWSPRSAGKDRSHRQIPRFRQRTTVGSGAVLIDDVCTTGATIVGAAAALGRPVALDADAGFSSLVATSASSMRRGATLVAPRR